MKHKLLWAVIAFVMGFLIFLGGYQYFGAAIIFIGLVLADLYSDERKALKNTVNKKMLEK